MARKIAGKSALLAFFLLLFPLLAYGQLRFGLHTGMNFAGSTIPFGQRIVEAEPIRSFWHEPGLTLGVSVEVPVLAWLNISPVFEYNHYFFDKPDMYWAGFPFYNDAFGETSRVYRMLLEARIFHEAANRNRVYLSTGMGYVVEKIGVITVMYNEGPGAWPIDGKNYWTHSLGLGYQFALSRKLALDLSAKYYSNYTDRCDVSTNLGVVYVLER